MFELHTDEVMFNMVEILISIISPDWKENILAVSSDDVHNMDRQYQGVVTHLDNDLTNMSVGVWYADHHIGLVMGKIFRIVVKY